MSSSAKKDNEILQLDLYEILQLSIEASEPEIKKAFRKKALQCHPDKNPDNPATAAEFSQLKKILEILLDPGSRAAYDRVLKGRKSAALRKRETSAKTQKFKEDLERREQQHKEKVHNEKRFAREKRRLEAEGNQIIADEMDRLDRLAKEERAASKERLANITKTRAEAAAAAKSKEGSYKVKVRWTIAEGVEPYTKEKLRFIFYKWGEIHAVVMEQSGSRGKALVDYKLKEAADMACDYEGGLPECPLTVTRLTKTPPPTATTANSDQSSTDKVSTGPYGQPTSRFDYESLADMEKRRRNERARLMEEMKKCDELEQE